VQPSFLLLQVLYMGSLLQHIKAIISKISFVRCGLQW